jgi:C-terminal processing protease CtpA/Prc
MIYSYFKNVFILGIIIPTFLFSACSDKTEHVYISSTLKAWLGIQVKNIPERRMKNLNLDFGLDVTKVYQESPAEKAGLMEGDILLKINGKPLEDLDEMINMIGSMEIGEKITITYVREGKEWETEAIIGKRDRKIYAWKGAHKNLEHFISGNKYPWLGVSTSELTDQLREFFNVPDDRGVLVKKVVEDSPAEQYGLKAGDIIIRFGKEEVEDTHDLMRAINRYEDGDEVEVKIIRDREEKTITVMLGEKSRRFPYHLKYGTETYQFTIPEMKIEIPEIEIDIPEIDKEELEELHEKMREEFKLHEKELKEELENLNDELKQIRIHTGRVKSIVI